jgi:modulator of FtsH protease HflK
MLEQIHQQFIKRLKGAPILILAAVAVMAIILWDRLVHRPPEETGIVQRFGKVIRTAGPGLHFKLPFGVETVGNVNGCG